MKMHVLPRTILLLPNARLLNGSRARHAVRRHALIEPHIADDRDVAHDPDVRRRHRGVERRHRGAQVKVKAMELHPFRKLPHRFGLKARQRGIAKFLIFFPIRPRDRVQQGLVELQQFMRQRFGHCDFL